MTTRYECDWCGETFDDRKYVASADVTIGTLAEKLHICVSCSPDHIRHAFPE